MKFDPSILLPGDTLLYRPSSIFGWLIARKTIENVSHIELYDGDGKSVASRDGVGVNLYPLRVNGLAYVLRPISPIDWDSGRTWFATKRGDKYDWKSILVFVGLSNGGSENKEICSEFAAMRYKASGFFAVSDRINPDRISPANFLQSAVLDKVWSDGK